MCSSKKREKLPWGEDAQWRPRRALSSSRENHLHRCLVPRKMSCLLEAHLPPEHGRAWGLKVPGRDKSGKRSEVPILKCSQTRVLILSEIEGSHWRILRKTETTWPLTSSAAAPGLTSSSPEWLFSMDVSACHPLLKTLQQTHLLQAPCDQPPLTLWAHACLSHPAPTLLPVPWPMLLLKASRSFRTVHFSGYCVCRECSPFRYAWGSSPPLPC